MNAHSPPLACYLWCIAGAHWGRLFLWFHALCLLTAFGLGIVAGARRPARAISVALGVALGIANVRFSISGASAMPGLVGYPLICYVLSRFGTFLRGKLREFRGHSMSKQVWREGSASTRDGPRRAGDQPERPEGQCGLDGEHRRRGQNIR